MNQNNNKTIRIAIDAMGGDFAPKSEVEGAILAYKNKPKDWDIELILVGDEKKIKAILEQNQTGDMKYSIVHADEVITMKDDPVVAFKTKKNSSLYLGAELHSQGKADAFVSAGNTGAMLSISTMLLGRVKGVSRPSIGALLPTSGKNPTLVLDVGATVDLKSRFLYEYAVMGSLYVKYLLGINNPKVALLNVGEEESKGNDELKLTHTLLKQSDLNFIGNVEGRDILAGTADVVVCDGYTGNVVLKLAESFLSIMKSKIKDYAELSMLNKIRAAVMVPTLKSILKGFNYEESGGVPMLGVKGVSIVGHGKSSALAICNMIFRAVEIVQIDLNSHIENALNPINNSETKTN